jgi:hypothetical protein
LDNLKCGSVAIARFLIKTEDGKEDKRGKNHGSAIQFIVQLAGGSPAADNGGHLDDFRELVMLMF